MWLLFFFGFVFHVTILLFICLSPKNAFYFRALLKIYISLFSRLFISQLLFPHHQLFFILSFSQSPLFFRYSLLFSFEDAPFISRLLSNFSCFFLVPPTLCHPAHSIAGKIANKSIRKPFAIPSFFSPSFFSSSTREHFDVYKIRYSDSKSNCSPSVDLALP